MPQTKAELYKRFAETFYEWKDKPQISLEKRQQLEQALEELAKRAIDEEATKFRLRETLIREELDKFDKSLFGLARAFGWLNQVGVAAEHPDEPVYAFFHPTFQEYFAACAIADWHEFINHVPHKPESGTYRVFEPQWKEVILLWLGQNEVEKEQKEEFIKALVEFEDKCKDFYGYRAYFLAAAGIAEFRDCSLADAIVAQIIKWSFRYLNEKRGVQYLSLNPSEGILFAPIGSKSRATLLETDRSKAIAALTYILHSSPSEQHQLQAATNLGVVDPGNLEAIKTLVELMRQSPDTRFLAAMRLEVIGANNSDAIAILIHLLCTSQDEDLRRRVIWTLRKIGSGNSSAVTNLVHLLSTSQDKRIRKDAVECLGKIGVGNMEAIAALFHLLQTSQETDILREVITSLGFIAASSSDAIAVLLELLSNSQDESIRERLAFSLGRIGAGNQKAISSLIDLLHTSQNEVTLWQTAWSLERIDPGNPEAGSVLAAQMLATEDRLTLGIDFVEKFVVDEIGIGNPYFINALTAMLHCSRDEGIRVEAARGLVAIAPGNLEAINALIDILIATQDDELSEFVTICLEEVSADNLEAIVLLRDILHSVALCPKHEILRILCCLAQATY